MSTNSHFLITEGAGFIRSHLTESLLRQGKTVTVIDDLSTGRFENIAPFIGQPGFRFAIDSITHSRFVALFGWKPSIGLNETLTAVRDYYQTTSPEMLDEGTR